MIHKKSSVHFIFITMFIDMLGIGILIPILPDVIRRFSSDAAFVSEYYGYFISAYALMQFFASPILGALSDKFGRRPILLISLMGSSIDYLIMAFSPNLIILFIGRVISGLTGASFTVASAYIADVSDDTNRSSNFGLIGAAFGLGFIVGPALGGFLGSYGATIPFIAAALFNLLNFLFGLFVLPESLPKEKRRGFEIKNINPFKSIFKILSPSPILGFVIVYTLTNLAGQAHPSIWTLFTQKKFGWSTLDVGFSLTVVGLATAIVQGGLTKKATQILGEFKTVLYGLLISGASYVGFALANKGWMMYAILVPFSISGLSGPALQSLISEKTPPQEQGELQGTLMSLISVTAIFGPLIFTKLFAEFSETPKAHYFPGAGYVFAAFISFLALPFLYYRNFKKS